MVENTYAKNAIKSDFHLELWLLKYSQNSGDCVELVFSKDTTTHKKSAVVIAGVPIYHVIPPQKPAGIMCASPQQKKLRSQL